MEVLVVSKADNQVHVVATLDHSEHERHGLAASSVRVWPLLVTLSSNNLSYARGGDLLHWWDTYPVPAELPQPYNDQKSWGVVPTWGYGVATESTTEIAPGTLLWGFWPTASIPVTLKLEPSAPKGFWTEISESRKRLMTIYNSYSEEGQIDIPESHSIGPAFGYFLSRHTFTSNPASRQPIHPLGIDFPWTAADADISASVVVSLSASSKTARSFAYHVFRRDAAKEGPIGFLQVSQTIQDLESVPGKLASDIPAKAVRYDQVGESVEWIGGLKPRRIVLVDFSGRAGALAQLIDSINGHSALKEAQTTIVQVVSEQKVYSADEIKESRESMQIMGKIQFNTSAVRDAVIAQTTAKYFYGQVQPVWDNWMGFSREIMPNIQLKIGQGVSGDGGIEEGWRRLCQGAVGTEEGLVYMM